MDLYILTTALDKSQAAVESTTDTTSVANLEQLVLGDNPTFNIHFTDGTAAPSWAGAAGYVLAIGLGIPDVNGQANKTSSTSFTALADGWTGRLNLATQGLIDALALDTGSAVDWTRYPMQSRMPRPRPQGGWFVLQIRVQDPDENLVTYAELRIFLRNRVMPAVVTTSVSGLQPEDYITITGAVSGTGQGTIPVELTRSYNADTNSTGNSTVSPDVNADGHLEVLTFSGSAGTRVVILSTATTPADGYLATLRLNLPATSGIVVEVRNATAGGTLLTSLTTDGSGDDARCDYYFDGTAWQPLSVLYPTL